MIIIQQIMQFTTPRKTLMCFDMREDMIEKQTFYSHNRKEDFDQFTIAH
jgi:hypothetical protein